MAEIILEPTALSKVIPLSLKTNEVDSSLVGQLITNSQFNTADTDAWFSFTLDGLAATTGTFDLALINLNDKSVFNHTDKVFNTNPFYYKLDSGANELTNEIRHAGKWVGQLVVTLPNGDSATRKFIFSIEGHILDGTVVQTILLEDYNALIADIEASKNELAQHNIDYASLIGTVTDQEAARVQAEELRVIADALRETKEGTRQTTFEANEVIRDEVVAAAIETEMIAQNVASKLTEKEATFAPRILSVEQQLEQTLNKSAITLTHMFADNTARDAYFVANPTELMEQLFIKVGTGYQQYLEGIWTDSAPIVSEALDQIDDSAAAVDKTFSSEKIGVLLSEKVSSVNNVLPDATGNVTIEAGGGTTINDSVTAVDSTWSSSKIDGTKANKVQENWITPTILNGWTEVPGYPVGYMKDEMGFVHLKGQITGGALSTSVFLLPVGYRPSTATYRVVSATAVTFTDIAKISISTNGNVSVLVKNTNVFFDGVRFQQN